MKNLLFLSIFLGSCSVPDLQTHFYEFTYEVDYCWPRECSVDTITIISRVTPKQTVLQKIPVLIHWPSNNMTGESLSGICSSRILEKHEIKK